MSTSKANRLIEKYRQFINQNPAPSELWKILESVPSLRQLAWNEFAKDKSQEDLLGLMKQNVDNKDIIEYPVRRLIEKFPDYLTMKQIIEYIENGKLVAEAAAKIIAQPTKAGLHFVLKNVMDVPANNTAAQALLAMEPSIDDLSSILSSKADCAYAQAARILLDANDSKVLNTIRQILYRVPGLEEEIWQKFREKLSNGDLMLLANVEPFLPFRIEVGEILLNRSEKFHELFEIFKSFPELRERVWEKISKIELSEAWIGAIVRTDSRFLGRTAPLLAAIHQAEAAKKPKSEKLLEEIMAINDEE